jgi:hypothetical protein
MAKRTDPIERFWPKVDKTDTFWIWKAARTYNGYGLFSFPQKDGTRRLGLAHRRAYATFIGPIPEGMELDHRCHVRECVNPYHLNPVTLQKNQENRRGPNRTSKSGYRGVIANRKGPGWNVFVRARGVLYTEGPFDTPEEANEAAIALRNRVMTNNLWDRVAQN